MTIVLNGTTGITTPTTSTTGEFVTSVTGFKNRIINGAMVIDQRYAGAATANTIDGFVVDRWVVGQSTTGKLIAQQNQGSVTPPAGFSNYLGVTSQSAYSISSSDIFRIYQTLEGYNIADFGWGTVNAVTAILSFWVRSSLTGTFGGAINNASGRYPFSYTINAANTWEQKSVTIVGSTTLGNANTTNGAGFSLIFSLGTGSTFSGTAGVWSATNYLSSTGATSVVGTSGATFYITGVQLEKGSTATSFDYRPYGTELALCQRYYQYASSMNMPGLIKGTTDGNRSLNIWFSSAMRAAPTMSVTWNSGAQTGSDWVGTNGAHSYKSAGNTTTELVVTAWTATIEL